MIRGILKRTVSLFLVIAMVLSLVSFTVSAAELAGLNVEGLTAESTGDANWTASEGNQITGTATGTSGTCGNESKSGVLVLKNTKSNMATLSFDYTLTLNNGTVKIGNTSVTENSSYSVELASNETLSITVTSDKAATSTIIILKNIKLVTNTDVNVSFEPSVGGTIKVNDETISAPRTYSQNSSVGFQITATPASSYKFFRWENENGTVVSNKKSDTIYPDYDQTIHAVFLDSTSPVFSVSGTTFTDLGEAIDYAVSANQSVIALIENGTISGNYTIPNGKTLLIPFDDALTLYKNTPEVVYGSHTTPSVFKTLTMANGSSITVASGGAICVPSKLSATGTGTGSWNGTPTGKYGKIAMNSGSSITVENGGGLYVYGYISGTGNVLAKSGATVYEAMQFRCWRGGSATLGMIDGNVFPMSQYYVQNIEAFLTLEAGAQENVYTSVNMNSSAYPADASFIGNSGMFTIGTGKIVKHYDGPTDRLIIDVEGDLSIKSLSLSLAGQSVNTKNYVLPINSNISINVKSGTTTIDAAQKAALLPGAELSVLTGAQVNINSSVYIYDKDEWGDYAAAGVQLVPVGYSTVNGTTAKRNANSLVDAKVDINGNVYVNGALYTTAGGAAIVSSAGSGKIVFNKTAGTETATQQVTQSGKSTSTVSIPITPARLLNGDGSYTPTANLLANTEVPYIGTGSEGKWLTGVQAFQIYFDANGGIGTMPPQTVIVGTEATLNKNTFTREGYDFVCWNTAADGSGQSIPDEYSGTIPATGDITLYAQWSVQKFTVTWKNDDGTQLELDENVPYGTTPSYDGQTPTKAADAQYSYTFAGWSPELSAVTGNVTYTATYTSTVNTYTVIWKHEDGIVLEKDENVPYGTEPTYDGETPTKAGDAQYSYSFLGWDPEPAAVTGDVTYTAVFRQTVNTYTVKWLDEDGSILETDKNVPYGATPEYNGETPSKDPTDSTVYTFTGWTPEVAAVTGDVSYIAKFSESIRTYTITWKDQNGEVIETTDVDYGEVPFHAPLDAYQDEHYSYSFAGWKDEAGTFYGMNAALPPVTGDAVYTAVFSTSLVNGYYLIGLHGWDAADLLPEDKLYENQANPSEMMLEHVTLQVGNEFKVVYLNNGELTWYPEGTNNDYKVDENHAGEKTVYFRPNGDGGSDWHYGVIFVPATYTVKFWLNESDEAPIQTVRVEQGERPAYVGDAPVKEADARYTYTFDGWTREADETVYTNETFPGTFADVSYYAHFQQTVNTYTVTWKNEDGTVLETDGNVPYGEMPVFNGEPPTKAGDAQYSYTFAGWTPEIAPVTGDVTYTARFEQTLNKYTVTWVIDGVETTEEYEYGAIPSHPDPVKAATAQYTYVFTGWTPEITAVTGNATYTALFSETLNAYTVTWKNEDGTVLETDENVAYGTVPTYNGATPVKDGDAQYSYVFAGWTPNVAAVTGDAEYIATFTQNTKTYTVTWVNYDGKELEKDEDVAYGVMPQYDGPAPTKPADAQHSYSFVGWTPAVAAVTGNVTYTATFTETIRTYTIRFVDEDDTVLQESQVAYGELPVYQGKTPTKAATAQYAYTFTGWDPTVVTVSGDATYTAVYDAVVNQYTIRFLDEDGTELQNTTVAYGEMPAFTGTTPTKPDDSNYSYTFTGWNPEPVSVTGDADYIATYARTPLYEDGYYLVGTMNQWKPSEACRFQRNTDAEWKLMNVDIPEGAEIKVVGYENGLNTWYPADANYKVPAERTGRVNVYFNPNGNSDWDKGGCHYIWIEPAVFTVTWVIDGVSETESYRYGETPTHADPVKAGDAQYTYTFTGWDPEIVPVTEDTTYTAVFTKTVNKYTVTWIVDGNTETEEYEYGATPSHGDPVKAGDAQYTYTFTGWDPEIVPVTEDTTYTAVFTKTVNKYTVTWIVDGNTETEEYEYGATPSHGDPVKAGDAQYTYTFTGWDPEIVPVTEDTTYTAVFTKTVNKYTVTWIVDGNTETEEYEYGATPTHPDPEKAETSRFTYAFVGWTPEITAVTGDAVYTADFLETGKNGLCVEGEDTYWIENGVNVPFPGLIRIVLDSGEVNYYYFGEDSKAVKNGTFKVEKNNDLPLPVANYNFDANGVIEHDPDTSKNGISVPSDNPDGLYYMIDGVKVGIGLFRENGSYYYARTSSGEIVRNRTYYVSVTNGLPIEPGMYSFDAEGRMILNGFFQDGSSTYYYQDGVMAKGFTKIGEDYYFFNAGSGKLYKDIRLWVPVNEYGVEPGYYYFGVDGKMELPAPKNGFVEEGGYSYYYVNGERAKGFTKIGEDYYFFNAGNGRMYKNIKLWVPENEYGVEPGYYDFGAEGKMILPTVKNGFVEENGSVYYYINGEMAKGLTKIGEDFYFFNQSSGKMYKGMKLWVADHPEYGIVGGMYQFDEEGRMVLPG